MQKKFIANLIFLLLLNLTIKPFWMFGIDASVQKILGTEEYGHYFALMNFSFLLNTILDVGLTNYNNRNISRYQFLIKKHFSALFTLKLMLGLLYFVVAGIAAFILGYHKSWDLLLLLLLNQFFVYLVLYLRSNLAGLQLFKYDSIVSVLDRLLMIIFCGILIFTNDKFHLLNIKTFVITQVVSYAIVALVVTLIIFRKVGKVKFSFNFTFSRIIIKKSLPYAILVLLMTFYNRTDSVMLERLLPEDVGAIQCGIYAHGYRLLDSANMIALLFSTLLLPMFSGMIKRNESVQTLVETSFKILMSGVIMIAVICFCYAEDIMGILYSEEIEESAIVFRWLILSLIPISITYIFGTLLTANGSLKWLNRMAMIGVGLNITLNFVLIPKYMAFGTAVSSLATQSVTALVQVFLAVKFLKLHVSKKLVFSTLIFALGVFLACQLMVWLPVDLMIWYRLAAVGIIGGILALILGLISPAATLAMFKNKGAE